MQTDMNIETPRPADYEARMRLARSEAFHAGLGQIRRYIGRGFRRDAK